MAAAHNERRRPAREDTKETGMMVDDIGVDAGNPAILRRALRTGGFASPPHDGFAFYDTCS
jgi:hypothetical protein